MDPHKAEEGWAAAGRRVPVSTYRLQFHRGFGFADARALVSYLSRLGVTDCYSSPCLRASPGSTHGYDICDHSQLNPELGSEEDYAAFAAELAARSLPLGTESWGQTRLLLPPQWPQARYRNLLTGEPLPVQTEGGRAWLSLAAVMATSPVALIVVSPP